MDFFSLQLTLRRGKKGPISQDGKGPGNRDVASFQFPALVRTCLRCRQAALLSHRYHGHGQLLRMHIYIIYICPWPWPAAGPLTPTHPSIALSTSPKPAAPCVMYGCGQPNGHPGVQLAAAAAAREKTTFTPTTRPRAATTARATPPRMPIPSAPAPAGAELQPEGASQS